MDANPGRHVANGAASLPWFLLSLSAEGNMDIHNRQHLVNELLGSAHLFVSAVSGVMEQELLSEIAGRKLTLSQLKILKLLDLTEARNVSDVAAFMGVSDAAASKSVDRLVRRKFLRRTEGRTDRRSSDLSLAAAGQRILRGYEAAKDRKLSAMFRNLDLDDLQKTAAFLERLTKGIVHSCANPEEICLQCGIYLKKRCLVREAGEAECQFERRRSQRKERSDATRNQTSTRGRPGMGAPFE